MAGRRARLPVTTPNRPREFGQRPNQPGDDVNQHGNFDDGHVFLVSVGPYWPDERGNTRWESVTGKAAASAVTRAMLHKRQRGSERLAGSRAPG